MAHKSDEARQTGFHERSDRAPYSRYGNRLGRLDRVPWVQTESRSHNRIRVAKDFLTGARPFTLQI